MGLIAERSSLPGCSSFNTIKFTARRGKGNGARSVTVYIDQDIPSKLFHLSPIQLEPTNFYDTREFT